MIIEIKFSKRRYHEQGTMYAWCTENIGKGEWVYSTPTSWDSFVGCRWLVHSMFGTTVFVFKNEDDATAFKLAWGGEKV